MSASNGMIQLMTFNHPAIRTLMPLAGTSCLMLGIAVLVHLAVLQPALNARDRAQTQYEAARQTQTDLTQSRAHSRPIVLAAQKLRDTLQVLPVRREFTAMAIAIAEMARKARVTIPGMKHHLENEEADHPIKASLTFQATGPYPAIYEFIHNLEASPAYLVVESLDVDRADSAHTKQPGVVKVRVKVTTFLRPDQAKGSPS